MLGRLRRKYTLVIAAFGSVGVVIALKLGAHWLNWEFLSLSPLFSGIVAANVFLMGFLLSGVLADFKESERFPGEIAATLAVFSDEALTIHERSKDPIALEFLCFIDGLAKSICAWFYKKERTGILMDKVSELNRFFLAFESLTQANFIVRLKQEQQVLRRALIRIHTIRETSFISSGYLIAEITSTLLMIGLIFAKIDPFYESLFVVGVIVFLLTYLIFLIRDLDNPFGYYESGSAEDISLKPLEDFTARIHILLEEKTALERSRIKNGTPRPS
jgi:hypothetical protein